jgi:cytosine/adenosine deaminase-related metal-dependent hydrolase
MALSLIAADAVIPMRGDAIIHGGAWRGGWGGAGVAVDSHTRTIVAVGLVDDLQRRFGPCEAEYVPGVMLPGFINAHVHLELGYQRGLQPPPAHFTHWVAGLIKNYPSAAELERTIAQAIGYGVIESFGAGVTCVGDISRQTHITRRRLSSSPLRAVSYGEIVSLGKMRHRLAPLLDAAADRTFASRHHTPGLSPHAPYTVEGPALAAIANRAIADKLPIAMHLAELAEETAFLRDLSGPFGHEAELLLNMDLLDDAIPLSPHGPLRWAEQFGLLGEYGASGKVPVLLAHVNYATSEDIALIARSHASVAYCPRTHVYFGHHRRAPHPYRAMLAAGVNVCLGTDSLASNPDLNILKEAQLLHQRDALDPLTAFEMITFRAADALGIRAGRLEENALADIIIMPAHTDPTPSAPETVNAILADLLADAPAPVAAWIGARRVM